MADLKQIFVFIASPGDVADARKAVRHAVELINPILAKPAGFLFEPVGWEDIPPGKANRTQDVINEYVDEADIFIGLLHQRFGSSTGFAESGTEEEFLRMEKRWQEEDPRPTMYMYFKKIPADRLADAGPQLKKLLEFKQRIAPQYFYHEFEEELSLEKDILLALADWIEKHRYTQVASSKGRISNTLQAEEADILNYLARNAPASLFDLSTGLTRSEDEIRAHITRLIDDNLCVQTLDQKYELGGSTDAFVTIARHLLTNSGCHSFLKSGYFSQMLEGRLEGILQSRYHCRVAKEIDAIKVLLKTSPSAVEFILFGDTTRFDNLADQVRQQKMTGALEEMAQEFAVQQILQFSLLAWINDSLHGKTVDELNGQMIAGQIVRMRVSAAFKDQLAFDATNIVPSLRVKAASNINAGQLVSGPPELIVNQGTILLILDEPELALRDFERALSLPLSSDSRKIALHNKGLSLLRLERFKEAIGFFDEALAIDPNLQQAFTNKELALKALEQKNQPTNQGDPLV